MSSNNNVYYPKGKPMKASTLLATFAAALASATAFAQTPATSPAPATTAAPIATPAADSAAKAISKPSAPVAPAAPAAKSAGDHQMSGTAAYYSNKFNGRKTASGKRFNNAALTAAHNTLPFGTKVKITNTKNNRSVVVRITDRGPTTPGRVFDLTRAAAKKLGYVRSGLTEVTAEIVADAPAKKAKRAKK